MAPPVLEEDVSDSDSISVTSTQPEPEDAEYAVEKINAEEWSTEDGVMKYLVKWEGYPLHEASWEPAECFLSEQILQEWEQEKKAIQAGLKKPFDLDVYNDAKEIQFDEQDNRRKRRAAKRRRLGMSSRNGSISNGSTNDVSMKDAADDPEDSEDDRPLRQKRLKTSPPKRKGVAQKVTKRRNKTTAASSSEQSSDDDGNTSEDPLLEETIRSAKVGQGKAHTAAPESAAGPASRRNKNAAKSTTNASNKATARRSSTSTTNATQKRALSFANARAAGPANHSLASSAARKSAPSTASLPSASAPQRRPVLPTDAPAKTSSSNPLVTSFLSSSTASATRKQRNMSESDSRHMRFKSMSEQERFRKHAREEGVPDPSMLAEFNPATGRFEQPASAASAASPTVPEQTRKASLPLASARQPGPPQETRRLSLGSQATQLPPKPPAPPMLPPQNPVVRPPRRESVMDPPRAPRAVANAPAAAIHSAFARRATPAPARERSKSPPSATDSNQPAPTKAPAKAPTKVCWFFKNGGRCEKPDVCTFAHYHIICPQWKAGNCRFAAEDCPNYHMHDERPKGLASTASLATGTYIRLKDTTCRAWASGACFRKAGCSQAHSQTSHIIGFKEDVMCGYWAEGYCKKSDEQCKFAHHRTEYTATRHWSSSILYTPVVAADSNTSNQHPLHNGARQSPILESLVGGPRAVDAGDQMVVDHDSSHPITASAVDTTKMSRLSSLSVVPTQSPPASTYDVIVEINCGLYEFHAVATLACSTIQNISQVATLVGTQSRLQLRRTVRFADLKHQFAGLLLQGAHLPTGDVFWRISGDSRMDEMVETYKLHVSCGVVQCPEFTLLLYPADVEEWEFLARPGDVTSTSSVLKFKLLPPLPQDTQEIEKLGLFDVVESADRPLSSSLSAAMHTLETDLDRLLKISDTNTEARVFIMMPSARLAEMKTIAAIFEDRFKQSDYKDRTTEVWTSEQQGSWNDCLKRPHDNCLLLVHPEIPLWDVSDLGRLLHTTSFRVFSVGVDPGLAALEHRQPEFGCQRLFPMGDVVFVTDDVFIQTPEKVLRIIDEINRGNKDRPTGATRNKIITRPGVRLWLMDLMMEKTGDRGREDPRWLRLLEAIWDLCPAEKDDKRHPGNPSEDKADLVSIPPEQLPTFQELLETDQSKATDYIVNWFAGWSYRNASKYRRFTICHEEPNSGRVELDANYNMVRKGCQADPKGWGKEYQYLMVQTPDDWLKDKEKRRRQR